MGQRKYSKLCFVLLAALLAVTAIPAMPVEAGYSELVIDGTSAETELNGAVWSNVDGDVLGENGVIVFPEDSTETTRIITRSTAAKSEQTDKMFDAEFTLNFTKLPEGEKFIFAMGLQNVAAMPAQAGNVEIAFFNEGAKKVAITAYADDDKPQEVLAPTSCDGSALKVKVELTGKQTLTLYVNGKKLYDGSIPVSGEGSVGFLETGSCGVKISDLKLCTYKYDRPQNVNFEEDFEKGFFNDNVLSSKVLGATNYKECYVRIEDYNGSKVLMFKNAGLCYIGTKYAYSNFELTFDVPYYQQTNVYDESGEVLQPATREFGIAYGSDGYSFDNEAGYVSAKDMFCTNSPGGLYTFRDKKTYTSDLTDNGDGRPFSIRLTVMDMHVTYGVKWMEEDEYHDFVQYDLNETPTGNILIWCSSGLSTSFAIDNIKVVNKDVDANVIDVGYKSSEIPVPEDFKYVPQGMVYNPNMVEKEEEKTQRWYLPVLIVAGVCVVSLGVTAGICGAKRRGRKGVTDEKQ